MGMGVVSAVCCAVNLGLLASSITICCGALVAAVECLLMLLLLVLL